MITLLTRNNVPIEEVQEMADHESIEMTQRYIEALDPLAPERRNMANVICGGYADAAATTSADSATASTTRLSVEAPTAMMVAGEVDAMAVTSILEAQVIVTASEEASEVPMSAGDPSE
eukprot:1984716-Prymnesium_polylepis.1